MNANQRKKNDDPELQRSFQMLDFATPGMITRERSFIRPQNHHNFHHHHQIRDSNKRRSLILNSNNRGKPTMEIYRPPGVRVDGVQQQQQNKLNVHAKEFTMSKTGDLQTSRSHLNIAQMYNVPMGGLQHSKSSGNILHQLNTSSIPGSSINTGGTPLLQAGPPQLGHHVQLFRPQSHNLSPILASQSSGNILNQSPRVHFKLQPLQHNVGVVSANMTEKKKSPPLLNGGPSIMKGPRPIQPAFTIKRSKSMTSADALSGTMGSLALNADSTELGIFPQSVQETLDKAMEDPRQLSGRLLMSLVGSIMCRAVEGARYALPAARVCISIASNDPTCTFLDTLLNTCQQWYHEKEKILSQVSGGGRPRLMAFLSFLLELYCQARRRTGSTTGNAASSPSTSGAPSVSNSVELHAAAKTLLTVICRCCEDCIRQSVPSPSDTENLFFILTYVGRDLESQLPCELNNLLSAVRDTFLNTSAAPSIRRTFLQLIELHASHWQLPGCAVLYYYPSSKS